MKKFFIVKPEGEDTCITSKQIRDAILKVCLCDTFVLELTDQEMKDIFETEGGEKWN